MPPRASATARLGRRTDFIAAAEHLIKRHYTDSSKLAVEGGSNGGLLVGAFLTQRPELARAVVARVGIHDMLRVELDANGQFNITEFGTVKDPEQFKALFAYSPFHHVQLSLGGAPPFLSACSVRPRRSNVRTRR